MKKGWFTNVPHGCWFTICRKKPKLWHVDSLHLKNMFRSKIWASSLRISKLNVPQNFFFCIKEDNLTESIVIHPGSTWSCHNSQSIPINQIKSNKQMNQTNKEKQMSITKFQNQPNQFGTTQPHPIFSKMQLRVAKFRFIVVTNLLMSGI